MCYTGQCPYEDFVGECTLSVSKSFPDDAWCVEINKEEGGMIPRHGVCILQLLNL